jgi:hypothetical protein
MKLFRWDTAIKNPLGGPKRLMVRNLGFFYIYQSGTDVKTKGCPDLKSPYIRRAGENGIQLNSIGR